MHLLGSNGGISFSNIPTKSENKIIDQSFFHITFQIIMIVVEGFCSELCYIATRERNDQWWGKDIEKSII